MRGHRCGNRLWRSSAVAAGVSAVVMTLASAGRADAAPGRYVSREMVIRGARLYNLRIAGEDATAAIGGFSLTFGERKFSGDKAIIWMKAAPGRSRTCRDVTVYIEGKAAAATPAATLGDRAMLVTLRQQGRVSAEGSLPGGAPPDDGLYRRAVAARQDQAARPVEQPARHAAPGLLAARGPDGPDGPTSRPAVRPAGARPAPAAATRPARRARRPVPPVSFHAEKFSSELADPKDPYSQRITIATGNVYLAQGHPDSREFLELRCQAAVLYSRRAKADSSAPAPAGAAALAGAMTFAQGKEVIEAVYLEGDVVIARGERTMRGPQAFYNFTLDRAYVVDGVFRTIQEQRSVPIFIRFKTARSARDIDEKGRKLPNREIWFKNARVTTSDFYSPTYHIAARTARLKDVAAYDDVGRRMGPERWEAWLEHTTFNVRGVPVAYWPFTHTTFEDGHTALRKVAVGDQGKQFGMGVETQWRLFRLLGLPKPAGFKGLLELSYYERGILGGGRLKYARRDYSGYSIAAGLIDNRHRDDFGDDRKDINVPNYRGRFTHRHKHFLPDDWQLQFEVSWYSDVGFNETFYPAEFYSAKGQETLVYAKKQRDNWAVTALGQYRLNRFDTQTESAPDMGYHLVGQPLADETLTLFSETHAGIKRWRPAKATDSATREDTRLFPRVDSRGELDLPVHLGPVNVVPYAVARGTYWDDTRIGFGEQERLYGQAGARANFHAAHRPRYRRTPDAPGRIHLRGAPAASDEARPAGQTQDGRLDAAGRDGRGLSRHEHPAGRREVHYVPAGVRLRPQLHQRRLPVEHLRLDHAAERAQSRPAQRAVGQGLAQPERGARPEAVVFRRRAVHSRAGLERRHVRGDLHPLTQVRRQLLRAVRPGLRGRGQPLDATVHHPQAAPVVPRADPRVRPQR